MTQCHCMVAELYARYAVGLDADDIDAVVDCFTADASYGVEGAYTVTGRNAIGERIQSRRRAGCTHLTCNKLFEPIGKAVRGRATFAVLDEHARVIACGEYDDRIARGPDGRWRFASRRITYRVAAAPVAIPEAER
jgi:hypothetical protein